MLEVWEIMHVMPWLSTTVAQTGWKVSGLGNLLLTFLDKAEPFLLLFLLNLMACESVSPTGS
jgi:hypothetical protein